MSIRIEASNFRCYESMDVMVPSSGLLLVDGVNLDEAGGSNSCGKTSFFDSWAWARYGWLPRWRGPKGGAADAVVRRGQKSCWVRVTETVGQNELKYERRRPNKLKIWKNGEEKPGWTQADLERELGQSPERFLVGSYLAQRRARQSFWSMGESDRMKLISVAAGQESSARAFTAAKARRDATQLLVSRHEGALSALESQKQMLPDTKALQAEIATLEAELAPAQAMAKESQETYRLCREVADKDIVESEKAQESKHADFLATRGSIFLDDCQKAETEKAKFKIRIEELERELAAFSVAAEPEPELLQALRSTLKEHEAENERRIIENRRRDLAIMDAESARKEVDRELSLAERAAAGKCPTCRSDLPEDQRLASAAAHVARAQELQAKADVEVPPKLELIRLDEIRQAIKEEEQACMSRHAARMIRPAELRSQRTEIQAQVKMRDAEISQLRSQFESDIAASIRKRDEAIVIAKRELEHRVAEVSRIRDDLVSAAELLTDEVNAARERLRLAVEQADRLNSSLVETKREAQAARSQLDEALDLMEVFSPSGWPSVEFEGLVQRVSDSACEIVSKITHGIYSTRLEQASEDSKGNQKTVLRPVVLKGGLEVPLDDPSGGKEAIFELAYDVAISGLSGGDTPLLVDEALDGLDAAAKEGAMEMFSDLARDRAVLVIDHTTEFRALFTNVWRVTKQNDVSRIELV
jgi:DNA repair exonuclease SbcCD ATPase subunit